VAAAASSTLDSETVTLRLPSGEEVDAIVPAGMSDEGVRGLMRQKHPEFFPSTVSDSMRDQALKSIPRPSVPMNQQYMIGGEPIQPTGTHVLNEATDFAKGAIQSAADVSTPKILQQLFKQYRGQPNTLKDIPGKAAIFLAGLMGNAGSAPESSAAASVSEEQQAVNAGQGISQTSRARLPAEDAPGPPAMTDLPLYQKLGIKTSPGFQMPTVREPVPLDPAAQMRQKLNIEPRPNSSITEQIKQGVPLSQLRNPPPSGESQFSPPSRIYRTQGEITPDTKETHSIQDMMRDRFSRDEAVNESEVLKNQAAGYSMDTPKGVQADQFAQSQGRAPKPRQPNEYGYKKPINQLQSFSDLTELLTKSLREANARKAGARR
jgi:hypothetical protein